MKIFLKYFCLSLIFILSIRCFSSNRSIVETVKNRTVYLLSGGFSADNGHHAIKLDSYGAKIDTSFYPADDNFIYTASSDYINRNKEFSADITVPLKNKTIYQKLMSINLDELKKYEAESQKLEFGYFAQEVILSENQITDTLSFYIPAKVTKGGTACNEFLFELGNVFPFDGRHLNYKAFYK